MSSPSISPPASPLLSPIPVPLVYSPDEGFVKLEYTAEDAKQQELCQALNGLGLVRDQVHDLCEERAELVKQLKEKNGIEEQLKEFRVREAMLRDEHKEKTVDFTKDRQFLGQLNGGWKFHTSTGLKDFLSKQTNLKAWEREMYRYGYRYFQIREDDDKISIQTGLNGRAVDPEVFLELSVPARVESWVRHIYVVKHKVLKIVEKELDGTIRLQEEITLDGDNELKIVTTRCNATTTRIYRRLREFRSFIDVIQNTWKNEKKNELFTFQMYQGDLYREMNNDGNLSFFSSFRDAFMKDDRMIQQTYQGKKLIQVAFAVPGFTEVERSEWFFRTDVLCLFKFEYGQLVEKVVYHPAKTEKIEWD